MPSCNRCVLLNEVLLLIFWNLRELIGGLDFEAARLKHLVRRQESTVF
jgi:hypothetical protein